MKYRSPLVTLAAVFVAFAMMFTVDMLSGPPGKSSAEPQMHRWVGERQRQQWVTSADRDRRRLAFPLRERE